MIRRENDYFWTHKFLHICECCGRTELGSNHFREITKMIIDQRTNVLYNL